jgi:hypothetical protein
MNVKELKEFLENVDENLDVCIMKNAGQGYGEYPFPIHPKIKTVLTWNDGKQEMIIID